MEREWGVRVAYMFAGCKAGRPDLRALSGFGSLCVFIG